MSDHLSPLLPSLNRKVKHFASYKSNSMPFFFDYTLNFHLTQGNWR